MGVCSSQWEGSSWSWEILYPTHHQSRKGKVDQLSVDGKGKYQRQEVSYGGKERLKTAWNARALVEGKRSARVGIMGRWKETLRSAFHYAEKKD